MKNQAASVYFPNLHGFRFLAAIVVVIAHVELFKRRANLPNVWSSALVLQGGSAGVDFFFVLSGFLITTLLLKEQELNGRINLGHFYYRRILRIWPLYYTVLLLCFFVIPGIELFSIHGYSERLYDGYWSMLGLSILFLPNAALAIFREIPYAAPLWSVGVEEQFYLFWPIVLFAFRNRLKTIATFIAAFVMIKVLFILITRSIRIDNYSYLVIKDVLVSTRMELMGIGGLGAYIYHSGAHERVLQLINSNRLALISLALVPGVLFFADYFMELHHLVLAFLFLVIILNGATNKATWIKMEGGCFHFLGKISFGIYLWHSIVVGFLVNILTRFEYLQQNFLQMNILLYAGTVAGTIAISWLSYTYLEKYFLRKKMAFSAIVSGSEARLSQLSS